MPMTLRLVPLGLVVYFRTTGNNSLSVANALMLLIYTYLSAGITPHDLTTT